MEKLRFPITLLMFLSCYVCTVQGQCSAPPTIDHATSNATDTMSLINGTTVQYSCKFGYGQSGNDVYVCINNVWKGDFKCLKTCPFIRELENGRIVNEPRFVVGTYIEFECNKGHKLVGYGSLLCRDDRAWRPDPPSCIKVSCGDFGNVLNANVVSISNDGNKNEYGSQMKVTCHENYILQGSPMVTCQADGTWESKPECKLSSCGTHPGLKSSCIYDSDLSEDGTMLSMLCEDNTEEISVTQVGNGNDMCYENEWMNPKMACYCDCKIKADSTKLIAMNLEANNFLKHNRTLEWRCRDGYRKVNDRDVICKDGKVDTPQCVSILLITTTDRQAHVSSGTGPSDKVTSGSSNKTYDTSTPNTHKDDDGISIIWIVAISIGVVVVLAVLIIIVWFSIKQYKESGREKHEEESLQQLKVIEKKHSGAGVDEEESLQQSSQ